MRRSSVYFVKHIPLPSQGLEIIVLIVCAGVTLIMSPGQSCRVEVFLKPIHLESGVVWIYLQRVANMFIESEPHPEDCIRPYHIDLPQGPVDKLKH